MHIAVPGLLALAFVAGCASPAIDGTVVDERVDCDANGFRPDWARIIADSGSTGVFVLWEPDSGRYQVSDTVRHREGQLPASTFKPFNALVALQTGAVADTGTIIPWDGHPRRPEWDRPMAMRQAMAVSCVPWFQEVARRAGAEAMQHWLDTADYGNHAQGDSIHRFWLQGDLRITPGQQLHFLQYLDEERLPFDPAHQRAVKALLPGDSTATWTIQGKTGWSIRTDAQHGWYVGWVRRGGRTAYFALLLDVRGPDDVRRRTTLVRALLHREGWLGSDPL